MNTPDHAIDKLKEGNTNFLSTHKNKGNITQGIITDTAVNGQKPYAVIVTCSDSRVPPEHIFSAGIGDLFVVRTAGNVIGDFELGSIEYGAEHLGAKVVVVMGHSHCGAVSAALGQKADGHIQAIVDEIKDGIGSETNATRAEDLNITHSKDIVMSSEIITHLTSKGALKVIEAKYDIETGVVDFR
ncbi:carbonic anhydrase [Lachnospiraceae bacterium ZAX-1]